MDRYSRHNLIDWFSQEEVSRRSLCIIGAGAVGNEIIKSLVLLGVGKVAIYDFDIIEEHNLTKSVLFRSADVGKSKAEVASLRASELDPNVEVSFEHGDALALLSVLDIRRFDCVISCVDNFEARLKLNEMCRIAGVDFVNLGIDSRYASVEVFPFSFGSGVACYECNLPPSVYGRISERYSCGYLKKISISERKIPTTIVTSGLAGSLGASVALRLGHNKSEVGRRILIDSIRGHSTVTSELEKNADCPCCSSFLGNFICVPVSKSGRDAGCLAGLIGNEGLLDTYMRLSEPIVVSATCVQCETSPYSGKLVGRAQSEVDESARYCSECASASVNLSFKQEFTVKEFSDFFSRRTVPVSYAVAELDGQSYCFSFERDV